MTSLLDYLSKKLNIDVHYLYQGLFWILLSTIAVFIINFLRSTAFANFLRPETYGTYRYILTIAEMTSALSLTGASLVISRSVAQGFEGTYKTVTREYLKRSWLSVLVTLCIASYYAYQGNAVLASAVAIAGVGAPLLHAAALYGALLEGKKLFIQNAKYQVISTLIPALVIIFTISKSDSIVVIVTSYFVSYVLTNALIAWLVERMVEPNQNIDPKAKSFNLHLSFIGTLSSITEHLDKVLLFQFVGPAQLAMYSFASALPQQFNILGKALRTVIYPKISNQPISSIKKHIVRKAILIFLFCLGIYIPYILCAPLIFKYFFPVYVDAILLSQVYALSVFLMIAIPYRLTLLANSCTKELYQVKIATILTRLALLAVALPLFGLWGVVFSYLIARFIEAGLYAYMVHFVIITPVAKVV